MKTSPILVLASALVLGAGMVPAFGATLSSAFTFQGRLVAGGHPANGLFDLRLTLFNAVSGGSQVGNTQTNLNVSVSNGLFTTLVDFGASAFDGTTYWVDVAVRPGNTANPFRVLTPRQRLAGTPYALFAANAARADAATTAGTVIDAAIARDAEVLDLVKAGDGPGSELDADTVDGVESAELWKFGGNNVISARDFLGTTNNAALELRVNNARALRLEPSLTSPNLLGGYRGNFIAAGVAGATIAGGGTTNDGTGVVRTNRIGANYGTIGGGFGHGNEAVAGTIGGGRNNAIKSTATNATVPGGMGAVALNVGQMAYANGSFAAAGDAQTSIYVLRGTTVTGATTNLVLDGVNAAMTVPVGGRWAFDALVVASTSGTAAGAFQVRGAIRNIGGTTAVLPGAPAMQILGADGGATSWSVVAAVDPATDALVLRATSTASSPVRWVATVRVVELAF